MNPNWESPRPKPSLQPLAELYIPGSFPLFSKLGWLQTNLPLSRSTCFQTEWEYYCTRRLYPIKISTHADLTWWMSMSLESLQSQPQGLPCRVVLRDVENEHADRFHPRRLVNMDAVQASMAVTGEGRGTTVGCAVDVWSLYSWMTHQKSKYIRIFSLGFL